MDLGEKQNSNSQITTSDSSQDSVVLYENDALSEVSGSDVACDACPRSMTRNLSRVSFGRCVAVSETFAPDVYDRTMDPDGTIVTSANMLDIAYWLDDFKLNEMFVHPSSLENTLIYMPTV
eukprot:CFRG6645T1